VLGKVTCSVSALNNSQNTYYVCFNVLWLCWRYDITAAGMLSTKRKANRANRPSKHTAIHSCWDRSLGSFHWTQKPAHLKIKWGTNRHADPQLQT